MASSSPAKPSMMVLKLEQWPEQDRHFWEIGTIPGDGFDDPKHADSLRPMSIRNAARGYGRFLAVLASQNLLDPDKGPRCRVTRKRVALFVRVMRDEGNCNNTIKVRLLDLRVALRIMAPDADADFSWITRPGGYSLDQILPVKIEPVEVLDPEEIYRWALSFMDEAGNSKSQGMADRRFRDGLIIAIFACRALRIRSQSLLQVGKQLQVHGNDFRITLKPTEVKNKRRIDYGLPSSLSPYLTRYLDEVRPRLLAGQSRDDLWIRVGGDPFGLRGIEKMIYRRFERRFNMTFGPHRFRHSLATALAEIDPDNPGLAACILVTSEDVVGPHYRQARQKLAALRFQQDLAEDREQAKSFAGQDIPEVPAEEPMRRNHQRSGKPRKARSKQSESIGFLDILEGD